MMNSLDQLWIYAHVAQNLQGYVNEDIEMCVGFSNETKPYPLDRSVIVFTLKKSSVSDKLPVVGENDYQTLSDDRLLDRVIGVTFYVPPKKGAKYCYQLADVFYNWILFDCIADIPEVHYHECKYVRDCDALVLETEHTFRTVIKKDKP